METKTEKNENEAIIEYAKSVQGAEVLRDIGPDTLAVVPRALEVKHIGAFLDARADQPRRRKGTTELEDEESFVNWVLRNSIPETSCIYASDARFVAIINDNSDSESGHEPGWGDLSGTYKLAKSSELQEWLAASASFMDQKRFAKLLEDRILDVLPKTDAGQTATEIASALSVPITGPMELMVLSRGLALRTNAKVTQAVNLSSGESEFSYAEEHTDSKGKPLKIPGAFVVALPIFERGESYKMPVRLRYEVKDGSVFWKVELLRLQESVDAAINEMVARVAEGTSLPVFRGTPPQVRW